MMQDHERKALNTGTSRSGTTIHGWPAVIFGLPFMAAGALIMSVAHDILHVDPSTIHAPRWVLSACGGLFGLAGVWVFIHGLIGVRRGSRRRAMLSARSHEPWLADHEWDRRGAKDNNLARALNSTLGFGFCCLFGAPFVWLMFIEDDVPVFARVIVSFFLLIFAVVGGYCAYLWLRWLKYGTSRVEFGGFPAFLGERLSLRFRRSRPLATDKITFTLRCIEEVYETTGSGDNRSTSVRCYQIYADVIEKAVEPADRFRGLDVDLEFNLPETDGFTTRLAERPPTYWELQVAAQTPGVDYEANFLIPVYYKTQFGEDSHG